MKIESWKLGLTFSNILLDCCNAQFSSRSKVIEIYPRVQSFSLIWNLAFSNTKKSSFSKSSNWQNNTTFLHWSAFVCAHGVWRKGQRKNRQRIISHSFLSSNLMWMRLCVFNESRKWKNDNLNDQKNRDERRKCNFLISCLSISLDKCFVYHYIHFFYICVIWKNISVTENQSENVWQLKGFEFVYLLSICCVWKKYEKKWDNELACLVFDFNFTHIFWLYFPFW